MYYYDDEYEEDLYDAVLGVVVSVYNHVASGEPLPSEVYCDNEIIDLWKILILDFENQREFLDKRLLAYR